MQYPVIMPDQTDTFVLTQLLVTKLKTCRLSHLLTDVVWLLSVHKTVTTSLKALAAA